jgi:hypothetical protein
MERSEMQEKVVNLGKALIEELGLEPGVDTLSRWLVHYIAEQLACLENTVDDEKTQAQQRCFETILTLWQHRSSFRNGHRPFENFEAIFKTLDALNPENPHPYFRFFNQENKSDMESNDEDVKQWLDIVTGIDSVARVLINFALSRAVERTLDKKTMVWLDKAISLLPDDDLAVVYRLVSKESETQEQDDIKEIKTDKIKKLEARLEKLDAFIQLSQVIREEMIGEIQQVSMDEK